MLTEEFPQAHEHLARTRTIGAPDGQYSKLRIFNPDAIQEISFAVGGHSATVEGHCILPSRDEMLMLHYKDLGAAYPRERGSSLGARLGAGDRKHNFGSQYFVSKDEYQRVVAERRRAAVDLSDPAYHPWDDNHEPRWWRPPTLARALEHERETSASLRDIVERRESRIGELERDASELRQLVDGMTRSRSWRYTAPLRGLRSRLQRKKAIG
jgi:hypothetical protein